MVQKVVTNLNSSRVSGPKFIAVVVLKNCESEFSYILAELFNMCLKESFRRLWEGHIGCTVVFKNVGERPIA